MVLYTKKILFFLIIYLFSLLAISESFCQNAEGYWYLIEVKEEEWLCKRKLKDLALNQEGVLVLGIQRRGGPYIGAPQGDVSLEMGDTLTCYGQVSMLENLARRKPGPHGDDQHREATEKHRQRVEAERIQDRWRPE